MCVCVVYVLYMKCIYVVYAMKLPVSALREAES